MACLAYVDDIVLLAPDIESLRKAIKIAEQWGRWVRMKFNTGPGKSAVMECGRGRLSGKEKRARLYLGGERLQTVKSYKYLGVIVARGGGWAKSIQSIADKCRKKTAEIVSWARQRACPLGVAERLWKLYVESAISYGMAIMELTECQERRLDEIQKVIGRTLLGHASDSPSPVVLEELAWGRWSTRLVGERARLLKRILASGELSEVIVAEGGNRATSWLAKAAEGIAPWCGGKMPEGGTEWKNA